MATNWTLYSKKIRLTGDNIRERQLTSMESAISNDFANSPSYRQAYFNGSLSYTEIQVVDSKADDTKKVIMKPSSSINIGDVLYFDNGYWVCFSTDKTNPVYEIGMIYQCNNTLKFYKNGVLYTLPCFLTTGSRNYIDTEESKYIKSPKSRYLAICKAGTITKDDMDLRFILNNSAYKVNGIDDIVSNGILYVELNDDEKHVEDDLVNKIAYNTGIYAKPIIPTPVNNIVVSGVREIKTNQTVTYVASKTGSPSATFTFVLEANGVPIDSYVFTSINSTSCSIKYLGKVIYNVNLKVTDNLNNVANIPIKLRGVV